MDFEDGTSSSATGPTSRVADVRHRFRPKTPPLSLYQEHGQEHPRIDSATTSPTISSGAGYDFVAQRPVPTNAAEAGNALHEREASKDASHIFGPSADAYSLSNLQELLQRARTLSSSRNGVLKTRGRVRYAWEGYSSSRRHVENAQAAFIRAADLMVISKLPEDRMDHLRIVNETLHGAFEDLGLRSEEIATLERDLATQEYQLQQQEDEFYKSLESTVAQLPRATDQAAHDEADQPVSVTGDSYIPPLLEDYLDRVGNIEILRERILNQFADHEEEKSLRQSWHRQGRTVDPPEEEFEQSFYYSRETMLQSLHLEQQAAEQLRQACIYADLDPDAATAQLSLVSEASATDGAPGADDYDPGTAANDNLPGAGPPCTDEFVPLEFQNFTRPRSPDISESDFPEVLADSPMSYEVPDKFSPFVHRTYPDSVELASLASLLICHRADLDCLVSNFQDDRDRVNRWLLDVLRVTSTEMLQYEAIARVVEEQFSFKFPDSLVERINLLWKYWIQDDSAGAGAGPLAYSIAFTATAALSSITSVLGTSHVTDELCLRNSNKDKGSESNGDLQKGELPEPQQQGMAEPLRSSSYSCVDSYHVSEPAYVMHRRTRHRAASLPTVVITWDVSYRPP